MKKLFIYMIALCLLCPESIFSEKDKEKKKVIAGTSHIFLIVKEIAGERIDVFCPMSPGMCPGHFDIRSKDLAFLQQADLFIRQGFEKWGNDVQNILKDNQIEEIVIPVKGNWMVPEKHIIASEKIKEHLCRIDPGNTSEYDKNLFVYTVKIKEEIKKYPKIDAIPVICSDMQKPFLEWLGCHVVASYGRPDELTSSKMIALIKKAKEEKVMIVVDNLQSGPIAGKTIAKDCDAIHVTLTNFPLSGSYIESLKENINKILKVIDK